ncbi:MAG TPA: GNAT family N-acetyltransferase [Gammaproteobacteria bacterium]|nr:GNAT family N-acetyltransferase [Gammaproteobacteria bacterium]
MRYRRTTMLRSSLNQQTDRVENHNTALREFSASNYSFCKPLFEFCGYSFTPVIEGIDRVNTFKLRAEIYDNEFGWANSSGNVEQDEFDNFSTHYVVKNPDGETIATIRTTDHSFNWMAEKCFDGLFLGSAKSVKDAYTNEASRLCIKKKYRNSKITDNVSVLDFLLAGLLFYNNLRGVENTYIITFAIMYKMLARRGMVIDSNSETITMADGCKLRAFIINNRASLHTFKPLVAVYNPTQQNVKVLGGQSYY